MNPTNPNPNPINQENQDQLKIFSEQELAELQSDIAKNITNTLQENSNQLEFDFVEIENQA